MPRRRTHWPRQWTVLVTAVQRGVGRKRLGWYQVNATTARDARARAIAQARSTRGPNFWRYAGVAKLANR